MTSTYQHHQEADDLAMTRPMMRTLLNFMKWRWK